MPRTLPTLVALLALCGPVAHAQQEGGPASPLAPLQRVAAHLDRGAAAFLSGASPVEAWKPWPVEAREIDELRAALKGVGTTRLQTFGFEFELQLASAEGAGGYYLRTYVVMTGGQPVFMGFSGRKVDELFPKGTKHAELTGHLAPFGEAATSLLAAVRADRALPWADIDAIRALLPSRRVLEQVSTSIERSKKALAETIAAIKASADRPVRVRVDDLMLLAIGADGKARGGVRGDFDVRKGKLSLGVGRYRAFPEDEGKDK